MPKLPDITAKVEGRDGVHYVLRTDCWVTDAGIFKAGIPSELHAPVLALAKLDAGIEKTATRHVATCTSLDKLKVLLRKAAEAYAAGEEVRTRVIRFVMDSQVSFWQQNDGVIAPNGSVGSGGGWWQPKYAGAAQLDAINRTALYRIGLAAAVFDKIETRRSAGATTRYERVSAGFSPDDRNNRDACAIWKLNSWTGIETDRWSSHPYMQRVREVPFTAEVAEFFHTAMAQLCAMARQLDSFFSDTENVLAASGQMRLLVAPDDATQEACVSTPSLPSSR